MRLHSPFLYGSELCAGFYPVGGVRYAVVPFCQFVRAGDWGSRRWEDGDGDFGRVGKMDIQANAEKKGSLICEYGKEGLFLPCNETNAMTVTFEETYLQELYEKGKTSDKKHRYQPDIVRRYQKCIRYLKVAPSIEKLRTINSLNYEALKGDKRGISSIRVNDKYRVEFTVRESIEEPIVTICNIIDLSNHYK